MPEDPAPLSHPVSDYRVIVVGASAGGLEMLRTLVAGLPADLPAALFVVRHFFRESTSLLPELLMQAGSLPALHPYNGQPIERGTIYVAPPDYHLILNRPGLITLDHGARENLHRPAIDPLFRSAARTYGAATIGVVLSGTQDDGAAGLLAIQLRGGRTIVQDPADAPYPEMPQNALEQAPGVERVAPIAEIPGLLTEWVRQELPAATAARATRGRIEGSLEREGSAKEGRTMENDPLATGPTVLICPECGGALALHQDGNLVQYRCHVGHIFGLQSLDAAYSERVEQALWAAMRALKERAALNERMAERMSLPGLREEYRKQASAAWAQARQIEELLAELPLSPRATRG